MGTEIEFQQQELQAHMLPIGADDYYTLTPKEILIYRKAEVASISLYVTGIAGGIVASFATLYGSRYYSKRISPWIIIPTGMAIGEYAGRKWGKAGALAVFKKECAEGELNAILKKKGYRIQNDNKDYYYHHQLGQMKVYNGELVPAKVSAFARVMKGSQTSKEVPHSQPPNSSSAKTITNQWGDEIVQEERNSDLNGSDGIRRR